jgi:hypothetical protein
VVAGSAIVFSPAIWLLQRWSGAVVRDPADAWGARWLGEHLTAHPYLTSGILLLGVVISSGVFMLIIFRVAKRLAAWLTGRGGCQFRKIARRIPERGAASLPFAKVVPQQTLRLAGVSSQLAGGADERLVARR